eukprot:TRINITY_DN5482_c0_g1_i4.p1 TRINITY_DN5482_c0_g1~~TRINITY_DN5482_c0_g1_i4.p1  ORF type:complete len:210 (+),score=29.34 TRINITY_DN5482_c0_g1_i4:27-656(+)
MCIRDRIKTNSLFFEKISIINAELTWREGPNYSLSPEGQTITKEGTNGRYDCTALGPSAKPGFVTEWELTLVKSSGNNMMLGIAPQDIDQLQVGNYLTSGWYIWTSGGSLYVNPSKTRSYLWEAPKRINADDKVKIRLDLTNKTEGILYFNLNETGWRDAFSPVQSEKPIHLCVLMAMSGDQIKIEQHIRTANPLLLNKNLYPDFTSTS